MTEIPVHPSVRVAWALAAQQARRSGHRELEPVHFLGAALSIMDDLYLQVADQLGLSEEERGSLEALAEDARLLLGLPGEAITRVRRNLTQRHPEAHEPPERAEAPSFRTPHRSEHARGLFDLTFELARRDGAATPTLVHLVRALLAYPSPALADALSGEGRLKPDLAWETRVNRFVEEFEIGRITIVMSDIEGSTAIKRRLGDRESAKVFRTHDNIFREELERSGGGTVIKSTGDGLLLGFDDEETAVRFALSVQSRIRTNPRLSAIPLRVRWGIHAGEILSRAGGSSRGSDPIFGITIDTTARIMSLGGGDQILCDGGIRRALGDRLATAPPEGLEPVQWRSHGEYALKGLEYSIEVFEIGETGAAAFARPQASEKARPLGARLEIPRPPGPSPERRHGAPEISAPRPSSPMLDMFGRDLTALAREGRLPPFIERRSLIKSLARYLHRTTKRNVLLLGEAGVGKSAVVEGFARWASSPEAPEFARRLRIVQVGVGDLVSGTRHRGDLEERVGAILEEVGDDPDLVLFLDELHLVFGGAGDGAVDIANLLKPALARDTFRCIGATTTAEFERRVKGDRAFTRRFQILRVPEPPDEACLQILRAWARRIEDIQEIDFTDSAIERTLHLARSLVRQRALPDSAIDLLENAGAFVKVTSLSPLASTPSKGRPTVGPSVIDSVMEATYGIPAKAAAGLRPEAVRKALESALVGQSSAVNEIVEALELSAFREASDRPWAVLLLTGPTGVGKTRAAEVMAEALSSGPDPALCRLNLSEFSERHDLARLTGAPPGFVGHDQPGALFRFLESHPKGVILLDEMEKAHPEVHDYFLQVFDKGEALDSRGRLADFRSQVVVMTANVAREPGQEIGFADGRLEAAPKRTRPQPALEASFRAEFLARIDRVVVFAPLGLEALRSLLDRQAGGLEERLARDFGAELRVSEAAAQALCREAAALGEGARGLMRLWEAHVEAPTLRGLRSDPGLRTFQVDRREGEYRYRREKG